MKLPTYYTVELSNYLAILILEKLGHASPSEAEIDLIERSIKLILEFYHRDSFTGEIAWRKYVDEIVHKCSRSEVEKMTWLDNHFSNNSSQLVS